MGTLDIQEDITGRTGVEQKGIRRDIILFAIEAIQMRTHAALGAWCNVHWRRRAPFDHAYQPGQELTLMSESPILHLNSIEGLFEGILLDAEKIPKLRIEEAGDVLTMVASFLNLHDVRPGLPEGGKQMRRVGRIMQEAVQDMGLQQAIRERFEAKIEKRLWRESWHLDWWNPDKAENTEDKESKEDKDDKEDKVEEC